MGDLTGRLHLSQDDARSRQTECPSLPRARFFRLAPTAKGLDLEAAIYRQSIKNHSFRETKKFTKMVKKGRLRNKLSNVVTKSRLASLINRVPDSISQCCRVAGKVHSGKTNGTRNHSDPGVRGIVSV